MSSSARVSDGRPPGSAVAVPAGAGATSLAAVAGRLASLLASVVIPLYAVGAVITHGAARWAMLGGLVLMAVPACRRRPRGVSHREAPATVLTSALALISWVLLIPAASAVHAMALVLSVVYFSLMAPRPYAEVGLAAQTVAYLAVKLMTGTRGDQAWEAAGVAGTVLALGVLLLAIRLVTERKVDERTEALAAANERLEQMTRTDPLTGVANRRWLAQELERTWASASADGKPVSLIMLDIDFFKQYNDRYGHLAGDACLQKIATALTRSVRCGDVVARYGGEEFAVILADTDLDLGRQIAERIRAEVAGLEQEHAEAPGGLVTVSVGIAAGHPRAGTAVDDLLRLADEALYTAKHGGRNRVAAA